MNINTKSPKFFFGWWINIVTSVITGICAGFTQLSSSVFFKDLARELDLSRAATSIAPGIGALNSALVFPIAGWLSDRFGPRWLIIAGMIMMSIGLTLMYYITLPWHYYVVWGVIIVTGNTFAFSVTLDKMLTNWFIKKRGLAFGIRFGLLGLIGAALVPLISWMMVVVGWRVSCLIWAGVVLACIPFTLMYTRQKPPEHYGLLPDGAKLKSEPGSDSKTLLAEGVRYAASVQEQDFSLKQSIKTVAFWLLSLVWIIQTLLWGFSIHTIPFLTDRGMDPVSAGSLFALTSLFSIPSRFFGGIIADRLPKNRLNLLLVVTYGLMALGVFLIVIWPSLVMIYVFLILWNFGSGACTPTSIVIISRFFGRKAYGSIQGAIMILSVPVSFFAPVLVGRIYDVTGNYSLAFILFTFLAALAAFLMFLVKAPKLVVNSADSKNSTTK